MEKQKFYEKKEYYIPIAIAIGILFLGAIKLFFE